MIVTDRGFFVAPKSQPGGVRDLGRQGGALDGGTASPAARSAAAAPSLSISHNCDKGGGADGGGEAEQTVGSQGDSAINRLTGSHRRTAHALRHEIQELAREYGVERLGFLTLTFAENLCDIKEAQRRFHNLERRVLCRYERCIAILERQRRGAVHFHIVVVIDQDIRSGVDFGAFETGNYRSAGEHLRAEWAFWRETAPKYGFGRTELLPVKSNAEGIAKYVGKYVSKHIGQRDPRDKGARLVRYIGYREGGCSSRKASTKFSYNSINGRLWREKLKAFCGYFSTDLPALKTEFGPRWCYLLQQTILGWDLTMATGSFVYPTAHHAVADGHGFEVQNRVETAAAGGAEFDYDAPCKITRVMVQMPKQQSSVFDAMARYAMHQRHTRLREEIHESIRDQEFRAS